ncbi:MAG: hypothetical protein RSE47_07725 [Acidaminococcaceae bacterium]
MNNYIEFQCQNIISIVKTFEQACDMAATKDDGRISTDEQKMLKLIHATSSKFIKDVERAKKF